jgi:hypothetical protein
MINLHKIRKIGERSPGRKNLSGYGLPGLEAFRSPSGLSEAKSVSRGAEGGERRDLRD